MPVTTTSAQLAELDRQIDTLLRVGYPEAAGLVPDDLRALLAPLADQLPALPDAEPDEPGRLPFTVVLGRELVAPDIALPLAERAGRRGFTTMAGEDLARFRATEHAPLPAAPAYLLTDVDTGRNTLDRPPEDVLPGILAAGRTPLTVEEGIAVLTHHPDALAKNACFSLLGSRCGDRRVPALWLSGGAPRLGWCWAGAPHTWLGSASAAGRLG